MRRTGAGWSWVADGCEVCACEVWSAAEATPAPAADCTELLDNERSCSEARSSSWQLPPLLGCMTSDGQEPACAAVDWAGAAGRAGAAAGAPAGTGTGRPGCSPSVARSAAASTAARCQRLPAPHCVADTRAARVAATRGGGPRTVPRLPLLLLPDSREAALCSPAAMLATRCCMPDTAADAAAESSHACSWLMAALIRSRSARCVFIADLGKHAVLSATSAPPVGMTAARLVGTCAPAGCWHSTLQPGLSGVLAELSTGGRTPCARAAAASCLDKRPAGHSSWLTGPTTALSLSAGSKVAAEGRSRSCCHSTPSACGAAPGQAAAVPTEPGPGSAARRSCGMARR